MLEVKVTTLTEEGQDFAEKGSAEARVYAVLSAEKEGMLKAELEAKMGGEDGAKVADAGIKRGAATRIFEVKKAEGGLLVKSLVSEFEDTAAQQLRTIASGSESTLTQADLDALKKRKLVVLGVVKSFKLTPGPNFAEWGSGKQVGSERAPQSATAPAPAPLLATGSSPAPPQARPLASVTMMRSRPIHPSFPPAPALYSRAQAAADVTAEMLAQGTWRDFAFKPVNLEAMGKEANAGQLHPLMKVRTQFRQIFIEMGFSEMQTNRYVESAFWNFDALFQPQQHPARDMHDTFFVKTPASTLTLPADYVERVDQMHTSGGYGSTGWRYDWSEEESRKNLLRTHTTAVSSRTLYEIAQHAKRSKSGFKPGKYFSIDRVFRNETLDATHLAEFHQVEGFIIDKNLTLGHLFGVLDEFLARLGMSNPVFKPTYNPYTEPSMEIHAYHEGLGKIVEIGNSGIFRPEMLRPMGFDEDVSVIAWGLSLERCARTHGGRQSPRARARRARSPSHQRPQRLSPRLVRPARLPLYRRAGPR
jgi:phenylalanyl-tRNA synthetase alpha subunit